MSKDVPPGSKKPAEEVKNAKKANAQDFVKSGEKAIKPKKKKEPWYKWGITVFVLSLILTVLFSFLSEITIKNNSNALVCVIVLLLLLTLNISGDVLANAVLSCRTESLLSMAAHKVRGAKRSVWMCKNATKIASIFADVIGDICGIVSGAAGAVLALIIAANGGDIYEIIASIGVSAVIGALTVGGKALLKDLAVRNNVSIVFGVAKFTTLFVKEKNAR